MNKLFFIGLAIGFTIGVFLTLIEEPRSYDSLTAKEWHDKYNIENLVKESIFNDLIAEQNRRLNLQFCVQDIPVCNFRCNNL